MTVIQKENTAGGIFMSEERKKASDIFNESNFLFGEKVTFDKAFPQIEDLEVEVKESGDNINTSRSYFYSKKSFPGEFIDCSNSLCYNGGFSIGKILREMVRSNTKELSTTKDCRGYEGSPKGRRRYGNCHNQFEIKITIKYKTEEDEKK
jgi:hypothetical protein